MIQITPHLKIFVAVEPVDFRQGIDGLAQVCKAKLGADPFSGALFVFRSRSRRSIRVLAYDLQGFWLCQKRLSAGRFRWWPSCPDDATPGAASVKLLAHELQILICGGDPRGAKVLDGWRAVG